MKQFLTYLLLVLCLTECRKKEVDPEPLAAFTVQNNNCTAPCEVVFMNASKDATSYRWDFADGQSSSEQNPKHTYMVAGSYIVKLSAKGPGGSHDATQTIRIQAQPAPPVADFSFTGGNCSAPCDVVFTNKSLKADSFQWDFGDGSNSTEINPRHQYTKGGTFQVALTAKGSGQTATKTQSLTINSAIASKIWDKTYGGTGDDYLSSVISTSDGGLLLAGYSDSPISGDKSENPKGQNDYWIVKISESGNKQWDKTFGGSSYDQLRSAISTPEGGFLLIGGSYSSISDDKSDNSKGDNDYWVVKINNNGVKQWDKTLGGSSFDYLNSVIATPDGSFLLSGYSPSSASGDKSENTRGKNDYWIVKLTAVGVKQGDKTLGGAEDDNLRSAIVTPDGGHLLSGYSNSSASGDKTENIKGKNDFWVVKIK